MRKEKLIKTTCPVGFCHTKHAIKRTGWLKLGKTRYWGTEFIKAPCLNKVEQKAVNKLK